MKKTTRVVLWFILFSSSSFSQENPKQIMSFTAGGGLLAFDGDIGNGTAVSKYVYLTAGYTFSLEKRFANNWIGFSLNAMGGKLSMAERSVEVTRNHNFQSAITQYGLNLSIYFQNKKDIPVIPYITAGIAAATLLAKTDIKYNGDSLYHYWSDGSIRNLPESSANILISKPVQRDYIYESSLDGAANRATSIPVGIGLKARMGKNLEANLGGTFHFSLQDDIDAIVSDQNDVYTFYYCSLTYTIFQTTKKNPGGKTKKSPPVDFASIDNADTDADGVKDIDDVCPNTPTSAKVDIKGCPLDTDEDGVPNYLDKETNTPKGTIVNSDGQRITDSMILESTKRDSLATGRTSIFISDTALVALKKIDTEIKNKQTTSKTKTSSKIPLQFQSADDNKDGIISSSEIIKVIVGFFEGNNDYTVAKIHAIIDFFFEQ